MVLSLIFLLVPYKPRFWHHLWDLFLSCLFNTISLLSSQKKTQSEWNCLWLESASLDHH